MPDVTEQTIAKIARFVGRQGEDLAHPGIGPIRMDGKEPVYHKYYQVNLTFWSYPKRSTWSFYICLNQNNPHIKIQRN